MLLIVVIYLLFRKQIQAPASDSLVIQGLIMLPPLTIGINSLPLRLVNWKKSLFFKQLDASPVPRWQFMAILILFFVASSYLFVGIVMFWAWAMIAMVHSVSQANVDFESISAGWLILGVAVTAFTSISIGVFIGGVMQEEGGAQAVAFFVYLPLAFLSGVMLPPFLLDSNEGFKIFSYFLPIKYGVFTNLIAWNNGSGAFAPPANFEFSGTWMPPVFGLLYGSGFAILASLTFKFREDVK